MDPLSDTDSIPVRIRFLNELVNEVRVDVFLTIQQPMGEMHAIDELSSLFAMLLVVKQHE